jgi:prepilin peptidase CpaA
MNSLPLPLTIALVVLTLLAGVYDLRLRRIPNWLTVSGVAAGFVLQASVAGWGGLRAAALGTGVALLIHLPLFALRVTGGGDVKLMAGVGAISGSSLFLVIFVVSALLGGLYAGAAIVWGRQVRRTLKSLVLLVREVVSLKPPHRDRSELDVTNPAAVTVPRGVIVLVATLMVLAAMVAA